MKKYNLSKIMKRAWAMFRELKGFVGRPPFSEFLRRSWKKEKEEMKAEELINKTGGYFYMEIGMCRVHINIGDGVVSGSTYKCKEILKRYGLTFNGCEKYWEGSSKDVRDLVLAYA